MFLRNLLEGNDMSENNVFNSIMTGLNEAVEDAKSDKPILKRHKVVDECGNESD